MNNFFEGSKSQMYTYVYAPMDFKNVFGALLRRKGKLKYLLASMKTLTHFEDPY
jgi:hypothetical protein